MSIPGAASPLFLATTGEAAAFEISRSLRFNSADTPYLNRTPSSASNRKTWTWSAWVKKARVGEEGNLFTVGASSTDAKFRFNGNDTLEVSDGGGGQLTTAAVFRDTSAWYHIVVLLDNTQATAANRFKLYINGSEAVVTGSPSSQNADGDFNTAVAHYIGRQVHNTANLFNGYLAEINFVDGSALDPTSFGAFDDNGVWQAIDTAGLTFGTNGFRLQFADNSGATATTLGKDTSGNSNNFTPNNLSIGLFRQYISEGSTSGSFYTSVGGGADKMFDGSASTGAFSQTGTATFTFGGGAIVASTSIKIRAFKGDSAGANVLVNGTDVSSLLNAQSSGGYSTVDVTSTLGGAPITLANVSMVNAGGGSGNIAQIFVDGLELITGSPGENDSLVDTPTNGTQTDTGIGGEVVGNYCTLNPLAQLSGTLSNGNLDYNLGSGTKFASGTIAVKSGKFHWEAKAVSGTTNGSVGGRFGFSQSSSILHGENGPFTLTWHATAGIQVFTSGSYSTLLTGTNYGDGDLLGCSLDADSNIAYFYKNGSLAYTYNFSSYISAGSQFLTPTCWNGSSGTPVWTYNFGARAFSYSARTNHKCLCTANLPTPTIADGSKYFDTKLWTGDGSTTRAITGLEFSPDLCWTKARSIGFGHRLWDTVRGATKRLESHATTAEATEANGVKSFDSSGFTIGNDGNVNQNNYTFVSWNWDAGTSTVTNNDGSIASQVRAQPSAGFSICTYTGNGTGGASIGHGLNAAVEFLIVKDRSAVASWHIQHSAIGNTSAIFLNSTSAAVSNGAYWNNTSPTSSVFTVGTADGMNGSGNTYVAYCFAPVAGYSAMGSYTGNGSSDGPFIHTGFRPAFLIIKNAAQANSWFIMDTTRNTYNVVGNYLLAESSAAETSNSWVDILSNGFKIRSTATGNNNSGIQNLFIAFAENPFQANGGLAR
nr:hypothetical protein [uncultured Mediterranean phage uvMED]